MVSLEAAAAKWARKVSGANTKYQAKKGEAKTNYAGSDKWAELGVRPGPQTIASYNSGLDAASLPANLENRAQKWKANFTAGIAR